MLYHLTVLVHRATCPPTRRGCCMAVAVDIKPLTAPSRRAGGGRRTRRRRARPDPGHAERHRGHRDARLGVPQAARRRPGLPARVGRAGPVRRPLELHRLQAALACCAGTSPTAATPTRWPRRPSAATARRRSPACRRSRAARSASSATTACAPSSRSAEPEPRRRRPARHGADALRRPRRLRPPAPHDHRARQLLRRGGRLRSQAVAAIEEVRERLAGPLPRRPRSSRRAPEPALRVQHAARGSSRRWSPASSSTSTPATPSRSCPSQRWSAEAASSRSRSTAACGRSTRRRTCTSWTSRTSRSSAPRRSRW